MKSTFAKMNQHAKFHASMIYSYGIIDQTGTADLNPELSFYSRMFINEPSSAYIRYNKQSFKLKKQQEKETTCYENCKYKSKQKLQKQDTNITNGRSAV